MDMYEKIESGAYSNQDEYPVGPKKPFLKHAHTSEEAVKYAKDLKAYESILPTYRELRDNWRAKDSELHSQFKKDALEEVGLTNHPKADKIYAFAYEEGHSCGLNEVWNYLQNLAELFN